MDARLEKIQEIQAKVGKMIDSLGGSHDHIGGLRVPVDVSHYSHEIKAPLGCTIDRLYKDSFALMTPKGLEYVGGTADLHYFPYSDLTDADLTTLHQKLCA